MKNIVIASGKGGTGKTMVSINLAHYLSTIEALPVQLLDADVEAPNDNLFINAVFKRSQPVLVKRPQWNPNDCIGCGKCVAVCQYNAIAMVKNKVLIFDELCHSCGACDFVCPSHSLHMKECSIGTIDIAEQHLPFRFAQGTLNIGESLAPMVVKQLKQQIKPDIINIIDSSPGTTCPVVKAMENMDYCILVTEPTPFGLNDLALAAALSAKLNIPTGIVINRSYGHDVIIEEFATFHHIPIIAKIPFDRKYAVSYSTGQVLLNVHPELIDIFKHMVQEIHHRQDVPIFAESTVKPSHVRSDRLDGTVTPAYKEMVVISGKGGTGKTTITSALAELMSNKVLADNDVDASNLHILCHPTLIDSGDFVGGKRSVISTDLCIGCGLCSSYCQFDAIDIATDDPTVYAINEIACEGCGLCRYVCQYEAISEIQHVSGQWYVSESAYGMLSHASLGIGEENSGKLVSLVRKNASKLLLHNHADQILSDGPPGTGCPVISAITGVDLALIVTEPTLSGIHDMKRALALTQHFKVRTLIVINKYDLNLDMSSQIEHIAKDSQSKIIGRIPFDQQVNDSLMNRKTIVSQGQGPAYLAIKEFWIQLQGELK